MVDDAFQRFLWDIARKVDDIQPISDMWDSDVRASTRDDNRQPDRVVVLRYGMRHKVKDEQKLGQFEVVGNEIVLAISERFLEPALHMISLPDVNNDEEVARAAASIVEKARHIYQTHLKK